MNVTKAIDGGLDGEIGTSDDLVSTMTYFTPSNAAGRTGQIKEHKVYKQVVSSNNLLRGVSYNAGVGLADGGVLVTYSPSLHTNGSFIGIYVQGSVGPSLPLVPFPLFHSIDTKILTK
jgi:hypothetical protein